MTRLNTGGLRETGSLSPISDLYCRAPSAMLNTFVFVVLVVQDATKLTA